MQHSVLLARSGRPAQELICPPARRLRHLLSSACWAWEVAAPPLLPFRLPNRCPEGRPLQRSRLCLQPLQCHTLHLPMAKPLQLPAQLGPVLITALEQVIDVAERIPSECMQHHPLALLEGKATSATDLLDVGGGGNWNKSGRLVGSMASVSTCTNKSNSDSVRTRYTLSSVVPAANLGDVWAGVLGMLVETPSAPGAPTIAAGSLLMVPADLALPCVQGMFPVPLKCTCLSGISCTSAATCSDGGPTVAGRLLRHGHPAPPPAQSCGKAP
eukprot:CAMPEP_0178382436 /NCGR_PEP_ID=MMETSP0689_2-20121128/6491_1 /TAXON_ID=160604 /ORGANISM="Amphidinium massartii, Strain CS-259" /LENGTH=270 /DNA_ID=CAMNT_0020002637 /DNA_START=48 /DNA_END=858 /DNA_ORIENTATION=-